MNKESIATGKLTKCPVCYHSFQVPERIKVAEVTKCPKCKTMLEVISLVPLVLGRIK